MNPVVLTKVAKFGVIGSASAFISFVGKFQPQVKIFFIYLYGGTLIVLLLAALWEGREKLSQESDEEKLAGFIPSLTPSKSKRQYLLSPSVRLELVIGLVVITISALIGGL